jgi:hypothetical protein
MLTCAYAPVRRLSRTRPAANRRHVRRRGPIPRLVAVPVRRPRPLPCAPSTERVQTVRPGTETARALVALGAVAAWCAVLLMLAG